MIHKREKGKKKETKKLYHLNQIKGLKVDFGNLKALALIPNVDIKIIGHLHDSSLIKIFEFHLAIRMVWLSRLFPTKRMGISPL